ncbi:MAG: cyanophycinase [Blastocatellia bacterium]|nr:cyanophycinase [Blastocatellia bacterium]
MRHQRTFAIICTCLMVLFCLPDVGAATRTRLVLVGGGERDAAAMTRFVEWAGGAKARLLVIPWASGEPQESAAALSKDLAAFHPASIEVAPVAAQMGNSVDKSRFVTQVQQATGVFFTGGDQARIMDVLADSALLQMLQERYRAGVVFGGTSAGTAVMSPVMITGEGDFTVIDGEKVVTRPGLGLLPRVILDQHFIKRQRENRLFGLVARHPDHLGIGIDEDTALLVTDNRFAEVVGATQVMIVEATPQRDSLRVFLVKSGTAFDLLKRKPIPKK